VRGFTIQKAAVRKSFETLNLHSGKTESNYRFVQIEKMQYWVKAGKGFSDPTVRVMDSTDA
jgi:hypothetical protein